MSTHLEICGVGNSAPKNTGFKEQCLETKLQIPVVSNGFAFPTIDAFKDRAIWKENIAAKRLVPLFEVFELADASTEDTKFESGSFSKTTAKGVDKITFECYISICAYNALKSYENSGEYNELFEYNEGGDYSGVFAADGVGVKGRKVTSIKVTRVRATKDKIPFVKGEITFADRDDVQNAVIVKSDLSQNDLEGIFDVTLKQVSATASSIKFTATAGCPGGGSKVTSFELANIVVKDETGAVVSATLVEPDEDGVYELVGTFADGYTVRIAGVIQQTAIMYEGGNVLTVNI